MRSLSGVEYNDANFTSPTERTTEVVYAVKIRNDWCSSDLQSDQHGSQKRLAEHSPGVDRAGKGSGSVLHKISSRCCKIKMFWPR